MTGALYLVGGTAFDIVHTMQSQFVSALYWHHFANVLSDSF